MNSLHKHSFRVLAVVFVVSFLLRMLVFLGTFEGRAMGPVNNGGESANIALNLVAGRGYSSPFGPGSLPTSWVAPFHPLFIAVVFGVCGPASRAAVLSLGVIQIAIASVTCCLLASLASQAAACQLKRPWVALVTGLLLACWPECVMLDTFVWYYFVWQNLLIAICLTLVFRRPEVAHSLPIPLGVGVGILACINPVPAIVVFLIVCFAGRFSWRTRLRYVGGIACVAICLVSPWMVRNVLVFGRVIPMRSNFGLELRQGNAFDGGVMQTARSRHPGLNTRERAEYERQGEARYMEASQREAVGFIATHPARFITRCVERFAVFWCGDVLDRWAWVPRSPWWTRGLFAAVKMCIKTAISLGPCVVVLMLLARRCDRSIPPVRALLLFPLLLPVPYYITHVSAMYAYQVKPWLIMAAVLMFACRPHEGYQTNGPSNGP